MSNPPPLFDLFRGRQRDLLLLLRSGRALSSREICEVLELSSPRVFTALIGGISRQLEVNGFRRNEVFVRQGSKKAGYVYHAGIALMSAEPPGLPSGKEEQRGTEAI